MKRVLPLMRCVMLTGGALMLFACGVPRESLTLATAGASSIATIPTSDADVRTLLAGQSAAWKELNALMTQNKFGGIWGVSANFKAIVAQTSALADREAALIAANQDDPANNRAALAQFQSLWKNASTYLNP